MAVRERLGGGYLSISDRLITVSDGRKFHIGPDYIYLPLHRGEEFEPDATAVVRRLVRPGDIVADVGANYGWYTTLFADCVGPQGKVFAFEPVPSTYERLKEHIQINDCGDRVAATRSAIGTESGEITMHVFDQLSHSRSSLSSLGETAYETVSAPIVDLDSFVRTAGTSQVDFLKCDVEGAELMVLQGSHGMLATSQAPIVMIELNDDTSAAFGYTTLDLWSYLCEQGYDHFYAIGTKGRVRRVETQQEIASLGMLLACKGERIDQRLNTSQNEQVPVAA